MLRIAPLDPANTAYDWIEYFYQNAREPTLPWQDSRRLSGAEKRAIVASIQQFQLGEGASGKRLLERAQVFAKESGNLGMVAALKLFLREEQRHSRILAHFLKLEDVPCLKSHWVHAAFRFIRGLGGLELCMKVLVTAEILARPYYSALRDATGSLLLQRICDLLFEEEGAHLAFQAFALQQFQRRHRPYVQGIVKGAHALLLVATAALVWVEHYAVFRSAGWSFARFWKQSRQEFNAIYR